MAKPKQTIASAPLEEPITAKPVDVDKVFDKIGAARSKPSAEETKEMVKIQKPASVVVKTQEADDWNQVTVRKDAKVKESVTDDIYSQAPKRKQQAPKQEPKKPEIIKQPERKVDLFASMPMPKGMPARIAPMPMPKNNALFTMHQMQQQPLTMPQPKAHV